LSEHKPIPCIGCHYETLGADFGYSKEEHCDSCHAYRSGDRIDVSLMESRHNPIICKACHMGNTIVGGTEKEIFHNGHNAINCTRCHTEDNFTVIKLKSNGFECVSCHSNKVHAIHIKKLDKICPICHGSWAKDKIYIATESMQIANSSQQISNLEKFTIFNFIRSFFNAILGGS
jgi:hypothetical protein